MQADTLLCATDGSVHAERAIDLTADLAKLYDARVILADVQMEHGGSRVPRYIEAFNEVERVRMTEADVFRSIANEILRRGGTQLREKGVDRVEEVLLEGDPADQILKLARSRQPDILLIGTRGLADIDGLLLGSVSHKVTQLSPCTTICVK